MITRRSLIAGLGALVAAPAIVRVSSIMPVKIWDENVFGAFTALVPPARPHTLEAVLLEIRRNVDRLSLRPTMIFVSPEALNAARSIA